MSVQQTSSSMTLSHLPTHSLELVANSVKSTNSNFKTRRSTRCRSRVIGTTPVLATISEEQCKHSLSLPEKTATGSEKTDTGSEKTATALSLSALSCAQCGAEPNLSQAYPDLKRFMDHGHEFRVSTVSTSGITLEVLALGGTSVIHTEHCFEEAFSSEAAPWD